MDVLGGVGPEELAFAHVEFEVVLLCCGLDEVKHSFSGVG